MDIVRSAEIKVKFDNFVLAPNMGTTVDVLAAVRDTMALFKVAAADFPGSIKVSELEAGSLLVACAVQCEQDKVEVKVTIDFCDSKNNRNQLTACEYRLISSEHAKCDEAEDLTGLIRRLVRLNVLALMRTITKSNPGPWGILRGVRPTKIVHRLLDQGFSPSEIITRLEKEYAAETCKAELVTHIAIHQRPVIATPGKNTGNKKVSVYIGIPYCPSRCLYCSFPAYVLPERREQLDTFLRAIMKDIESAANLVAKFDLAVENIYMGGGTPTSLTATDLAGLLALIKKAFWGITTREFTVEAGRPDSIDDEKIDVFRQYGINRASINPQTMQDKTLKQIGRRHTVQDIIDIFAKIRHAGVPVINMDVIAGLPGENQADMDDTMRQIALLNPENITVHTLALKRGSILKESLSAGILAGQVLPNEEITHSMLKIAAAYTAKMNMHPYYLYRQKYMTGNLENVGYAKPATDCFYNIQIMEERQTIIGIGPAAGTKAVNTQNWRLQSSYNAKDVFSYIKNLDIYLNERNTLLSRLYGDHEED
ncbi:tRNA-2-methylthio-N(6)-dimethylallyladenosine synthase [Sporomusa acidovorans DSM 3132]|uniref:tRNA-2-methylthio-N(6)-dimethylallyladenosine synthase n=1 Tax=Sporomusa acidovorans (strain ATCC 49682 / DSM 3132 / Mol) TaxID=1123286 RepID=A0ABZ3J3I8_SPOA4|nr:oxygen-independent coproporphyrinogen-III oxidase-like protein HemZ [Sporomusa acidovorans DSM 3132]SDE59852.1 oxygen-independent coproporphyrinogen-3 oxidase [Sporomusa acidovorans]